VTDAVELTGDPKRKRADVVSGILLALMMLSALVLMVPTMFNVASGPLPVRRGDRAPAFVAQMPSGESISLDQNEKRVVLIDFWATWCPPCVASMPVLERLYRGYQGRGFVVLGVDQEPGDEETVRAFLRRNGITFPIAMDPGTISKSYGVFTFPTSFLVGKDGIIRDVHRGVADESNLRSQIEALVLEK
jgi:peroxiredoxin